jgi:hypothetical protein
MIWKKKANGAGVEMIVSFPINPGISTLSNQMAALTKIV